MGKRFQEWKKEIKRHKKVMVLSLIFFGLANLINHFAGTYADKVAGAATSDLILDHIYLPILSPIFSYGYIIIFTVFFLYPLIFKVSKFHTAISQFSILVLIRSFFVILTHLRAPLGAFRGNLPLIYQTFSFSNDMFFSGHVALPFMGFLVFRKEKIGKFFLIASIIMAFTVLSLHIHYSIDVFAAFFITYCIYLIGNWIFDKIKEKN